MTGYLYCMLYSQSYLLLTHSPAYPKLSAPDYSCNGVVCVFSTCNNSHNSHECSTDETAQGAGGVEQQICTPQSKAECSVYLACVMNI